MNMGDYNFSWEFFLFELAGVDFILGMTWLATLGEIKVSWRTLTVSFSHQKVEVNRNRSGCCALDNRTQATKNLEKQQGKTPAILVSATEDRPLQQILNEYSAAFVKLEGWPPIRVVDHHIPVKAGTNPVHARVTCLPKE